MKQRGILILGEMAMINICKTTKDKEISMSKNIGRLKEGKVCQYKLDIEKEKADANFWI